MLGERRPAARMSAVMGGAERNSNEQPRPPGAENRMSQELPRPPKPTTQS
jgi:hypothetical protein